ncbi:MAG: response regulator [Elusimicrobia bacterium]|nr:response regulator [Elusimicrobiota bacterium]
MAKKVLVVDDDPVFCVALREFLTQAGYEVLTACDAYSGVSAAVANKPDLILLDIMMPAGSGGDVYARLRGNAILGSTPVIVLSALQKQQAQQRIPEASWAGRYFQKPVDFDALLKSVAKLIGR